jgi:hypothetical protein
MSSYQIEAAASVTIVPLRYRARCTRDGCANLGRLILRYADFGGRQMSNAELCHAHARVRVASGRTTGLKVCDDRQFSNISICWVPRGTLFPFTVVLTRLE